MKTQITITIGAVALYALIAPTLILSTLKVLAFLALPVLMLAVYMDNKSEIESFSPYSVLSLTHPGQTEWPVNSAKIVWESMVQSRDWNYNNYMDCVALCYTIEQKQAKPKAKRKSRAKAKPLTIIQELTQLDNSFKFAFSI